MTKILPIMLCLSILSCSTSKNNKSNSQKIYNNFTDCNSERKEVKEISNQIGFIKKLNDTNWYILTEDPSSTRYQICEIPKELQIDNLKVKFSGIVKEINPTERRSSTPFFLKELSVVK